MSGERDLQRLISAMDPDLRPGAWVFATVDEVPAGCSPLVTVREDEGTTVVVERKEADHLGLAYDHVAAMVTLRVHSALAAVGLTAFVAGRLARVGMSCNVVAGYHHDHLFVPFDRGAEAVAVLTEPAVPSQTSAAGDRRPASGARCTGAPSDGAAVRPADGRVV
jgi:hypothetical protein